MKFSRADKEKMAINGTFIKYPENPVPYKFLQYKIIHTKSPIEIELNALGIIAQFSSASNIPIMQAIMGIPIGPKFAYDSPQNTVGAEPMTSDTAIFGEIQFITSTV